MFLGFFGESLIFSFQSMKIKRVKHFQVQHCYYFYHFRSSCYQFGISGLLFPAFITDFPSITYLSLIVYFIEARYNNEVFNHNPLIVSEYGIHRDFEGCS
jgi:hypothetical protein